MASVDLDRKVNNRKARIDFIADFQKTYHSNRTYDFLLLSKLRSDGPSQIDCLAQFYGMSVLKFKETYNTTMFEQYGSTIKIR